MKGESVAGPILVGFAALAVVVWVAFFAPCSALMWFPVKDLPARCLPGAP